jgi:hypothetical protein
MPRRSKKRKQQKRGRKWRRPPATKSAKKPKLVVYEFCNPAVEGRFTVELPAGWQAGRISLGKPKAPPR